MIITPKLWFGPGKTTKMAFTYKEAFEGIPTLKELAMQSRKQTAYRLPREVRKQEWGR